MIKVRAQSEKVAEILIYDVIGADFFGEGVTAKKVKAALEALGDVSDINVRINSPGGNVWDGIAIFNLLKEHKAQVHVHVDGLAASAASLIAMAGDLISMGDGSMMMIHNPWTFAYGDAKAMRKTGDILDKITQQFVGIYATRSGAKAKEVGEFMDAETWFSADDAIKHGFADDKTVAEMPDDEESAAARGHSDEWKRVMSHFKKTPKSLLTTAADVQRQTIVVNNDLSPAQIQQIAAAVAQSVHQPPSVTPTKETQVEKQESVTQADVQKAAADAAQAALAAETTRKSGIKTAFGRFREQFRDLYDACIEDVKCTIDQAREKLLAKLGDGSAPVGSGSVIVPGLDARDKMRTGMALALAVRAGLEKPTGDNEFQGYSLTDMAEHCLVIAGISVRGLTKDGIARKVLAIHTTSDFPALLSNTAGKMLRKAYGEFPTTWRLCFAAGQVSDFKIHPRIQLGSFGALATIPEGSEYTYTTTKEEAENAQAVTKGRAIQMTRQMLVNDDLGGFVSRAQRMGRSAARSVNSDAFTYLISGSGSNGPTMADTGQMFNATAVTTAGGHANLTTGPGTVISVDNIGIGRQKMRVQKDKALQATLNIEPTVLLCSTLKEDLANQVVKSRTKDGQSNPETINVHQNRVQVVSDPVVDAVNSGLSWWLLANPADVPVIEVVFLDGVQEPFIDEMVEFSTDALHLKVRLDYGVANGDWRGGYKNVGV